MTKFFGQKTLSASGYDCAIVYERTIAEVGRELPKVKSALRIENFKTLFKVKHESVYSL